MQADEISKLFDEWNSALQTGDPQKVTALYEPNAILLPTLSNQVRHNHDEIADYFVAFCAKGPVGVINESNIRHFGQMAVNSGVYTFNFKDGSAAQARFTYVYRWNGQRWMIAEHHSSQMPEPTA
ncbi:MAG: SgcJ/EcaC family oxidoreductase [Blastopirellula sp. JB062]